MTINEVYVALLDEGVAVWRPTPAYRLDDGHYVLLRPDDYDPDIEAWEFPPGTVVRCENRSIKDGQIFAAIDRVNLPNKQIA